MMNTKRYLIASIAAAAFLMLYGFVVNTIVLADFYEANTAIGLMRAEEDQIMWAILLSTLLQALALGFIFTRGYEGKGIGEGVRFGFLVAWFVAALYLLFYALQPWDTTATLVAMVVDGIMYIGAGIVLSLLYQE